MHASPGMREGHLRCLILVHQILVVAALRKFKAKESCFILQGVCTHHAMSASSVAAAACLPHARENIAGSFAICRSLLVTHCRTCQCN